MGIDTYTILSVEPHNEAVLELHIYGKLSLADYVHFIPVIERMGDEHGKLRVLFLMRDFDGWAAGALWDNVKVGLPRFDQVERLAIVADRRWERGMGVFCGPFTEAEVRFFVIAEADEARQWVWEGLI